MQFQIPESPACIAGSKMEQRKLWLPRRLPYRKVSAFSMQPSVAPALTNNSVFASGFIRGILNGVKTDRTNVRLRFATVCLDFGRSGRFANTTSSSDFMLEAILNVRLHFATIRLDFGRSGRFVNTTSLFRLYVGKTCFTLEEEFASSERRQYRLTLQD